MLRKLLLAALLLLPVEVFAGSPVPEGVTASQVQLGFLTTSGCPAGQSVCWIPYSNTNPLPTTGGGGGGGGAITAPLGTGISQANSVATVVNNAYNPPADEAAFTAGTTPFVPAGGFFQTTATANPLTTGQSGMAQFTAQRAAFTNLRNASGTEVGTSAAPLFTQQQPTVGASTDISGTVATGGTYQTAAASSATRKNCTIQNPTTATEVLSVKIGTMANPFTLIAGASISSGFASDAITVTGATTSHAFVGTCQ